jgi:hypothetical protein
MGSMVTGEKIEKEPVRRIPANMTTSMPAEIIPAQVRYFFFIAPQCNVFCALREKFLSLIPHSGSAVLPGFRKNEGCLSVVCISPISG